MNSIHTLCVFFRRELHNQLEGTLTGVIREEGAVENIRSLVRRLTGSWRNLQNEEFHEFYR
jgi:hypothetical protein